MSTPNDTKHDSPADYAELVRGVTARVMGFHRDLQKQLDVQATEAPNYYHGYPFLFRDAFPAVTDEQASTLAVAGVFYLNHLCLVDDIVDSRTIPAPQQLFLSSLLHEEAILQLGSLLPHGSPFWAELSSYHREFAAAMLREQTHHTAKLLPYSAAEVYQIAKGKAALSKMTTTALAHLAQQPEKMIPFAASQDCFNAARQLYDDVKDWKEDYLSQRYSSLITAPLLELRPDQEGEPADGISTVDLSAQLHAGGHIEAALTQSARWCEEALAHVAPYSVNGWVRLVQSLRSQVLRLRDDLATIRTEGHTAAQSIGTTQQLGVESA